MFDFLNKPLITEKATQLIEKQQYSFEVNSRLNKSQIKAILELFYGIPIQWIKISKLKRLRSGSPVRSGAPRGPFPDPKKKVIIKFSKQIPIFE
uniref:Large ribosomal subunit protein uL23c n=1 Tax=Caulerpa cliftonii TaxID=1004391 RepID=A0A1C9JBN8_9CHLO|nr:ribosomal protein L23 [Caulerpa cliftonii]AOP19251.1 ribosomal protein L23 [Caulerpa cliftonii]